MRVSTIIPVFNGREVVARAIDSVLAQDFADTELIIVNDGATDGTACPRFDAPGQLAAACDHLRRQLAPPAAPEEPASCF